MHRQRNIISGSYQDLQVNCHSETIIQDLLLLFIKSREVSYISEKLLM